MKNNTLKERIAALKELRIQEILDDPDLSKIEKLKMLKDENLFDYADDTQDELAEWEEEAQKLHLEKAQQAGSTQDWAYTDSVFSNYCEERSEICEYADLLERALEDAEPEDLEENPIDPLVVVVTSRGEFAVELKKRYSELVDKTFDFCVQNRWYGFCNDW